MVRIRELETVVTQNTSNLKGQPWKWNVMEVAFQSCLEVKLLSLYGLVYPKKNLLSWKYGIPFMNENTASCENQL